MDELYETMIHVTIQHARKRLRAASHGMQAKTVPAVGRVAKQQVLQHEQVTALS
jgi:hypothetical protein